MNESPLNANQINLIDQLNLSTIEKHHLRLLGHCLESFKRMSKGDSYNRIPSRQQQFDWCASNPKLSKDREFIPILLNQFTAAAVHLEELASIKRISPLDLTLDDLIADALSRSEQGD